MTSTLLNALETLLPAVITLLYAALIGLGVQAAVAGYVRFPRSLGITAGIGLSLTTLLMVYSHRLFENAALPILPLAILAGMAIGARLFLGASKPMSRDSASKKGPTTNAWNPITITDCIAAFATLLVLVPVLRYGLTYWTLGTVDFPSYASSADIWINSPASFAEKHPDAFGSFQLHRATHEKPVVTALLILTSKLSSYPPYQLLTPILVALLFIGISSLLIIRKLFGIGYLPAALAITLPTFSVVPLSRIYDAQPGQVAAIALLACLLALLATSAYRTELRGKLILAFVVGIVGAAALGTNFTLVAGSSLMLAAMFLWVLSRRPQSFRRRLEPAILATVLTITFSVPMADMYRVSFVGQTTGLAGFDIPLASPLALIGQQISLHHVAPENQVLLSWCLVIVIAAAVLWARPSGRFRLPFDVLFLLATIANALLIGLKLGWNNYSIHKWLAVFIAFAGPFLIAYGTSLLRGRDRIALILLMIPLAASSAFFGLRQGFDIKYVISRDLLSLTENETLANQDTINLRLGDLRENSVAALAVPARSVIVTERTYAPASLPGDGMSLVRRDQVDIGEYSESIVLNDTYAMIPTYLSIDEETVEFTNTNPRSRNFLFGAWYSSEGWGTWSGRGDNYVMFDVPEKYRAGDIVLTVTGTAYAPKDISQTVEILVNGEMLVAQRYPNSVGRTFEIHVPERIVNARGGRMTVNFRVAQPHSPSQFGSADRRALGFGLTSLAISPVE